jgi:hypothetical protein
VELSRWTIQNMHGLGGGASWPAQRSDTLPSPCAQSRKRCKYAGSHRRSKDHALIAETLQGIKRFHGSATHQKVAVLKEDVRIMLRMLPTNFTRHP